MCVAQQQSNPVAGTPDAAMQSQAYQARPAQVSNAAGPASSGNMALDGGVSTGRSSRRQSFGGNDALMENLGGGGSNMITGTAQTFAAAVGGGGGGGRRQVSNVDSARLISSRLRMMHAV